MSQQLLSPFDRKLNCVFSFLGLLLLTAVSIPSFAAAEEKEKAPEKPAPTEATAEKVKDERPPGGDGSMFYRVFVSRSDQNGDGVIEKSEFRGGGGRFDQMDKNKNGKLDRAEIDELHKSRVADPKSMRQRIAEGETRRPPVDLSKTPEAGTTKGEKPSPSKSESGEPTALTPIGTRITAKEAFARLDADENGKVTPTEFQRSPGMTDAKKATEVVSKVDENSDGFLSFDEFNRVFTKRHAKKPGSGE
jgi:hypothetical protein